MADVLNQIDFLEEPSLTRTPLVTSAPLDVSVTWSHVFVSAIAAGIFAGFVATACTVAVEKLGGKLGGIIAVVPTTIVPAILGFYDVRIGFQQATCFTPFGLLANCVFLLVWNFLPSKVESLSSHKRLAFLAFASLALWALAACIILFIVWPLILRSSIPLIVAGAVAAFIHLSMGLIITFRPPPAPRGSSRVPLHVLLIRAVMAGTAITLSILVGKATTPHLASLLSVFPAIFLTTMVATALSQGDAVRSGAVGPMLLGSASTAVFSLLSSFVLPILGPWVGVVVCWVCGVVCVTLPAYAWLTWRRKQCEKSRGLEEARLGGEWGVHGGELQRLPSRGDDFDDIGPLAAALRYAPEPHDDVDSRPWTSKGGWGRGL